jgi:hypothetical protein
MNNLIRMWALAAVLVSTAGSLSAATPSEFYLGLLRRGTAAYEATRYPDAVKQLRIAAFGLVEAVDQYQIAQVYLTLTYDKLSDADRARDAAHRVFVAEKVERKYKSLPLSDSTRTAFEAVAGKLLSPTESSVLLRGAEIPPQAPANEPQPSTTVPAASKPQASASTPATAPRRTTTSVAQQTKPAPTQPRNTIPAPQPTTAENTPPQTITPNPQPEKRAAATPQPAKPQPQPATPAPQTTKPVQTATTQTSAPPKPATATASKTESNDADGRGGPIEPAKPTTAPAPPPAPRALTAGEVSTRMTSGERALNSGNLTEARRVYRELLGAPGLDHDTLVRVAEGLYRARDFSGALGAFNRVGTLRRGEEPYRYYIAVASFETGDFARAKKELAAALPYIEVTPDVARYRAKIEASM